MPLLPRMTIYVGLFFGLASAEAREVREFFTGVRGLGMGGVQVPTVNDETALFANPAALGRLRGSYITLLDPEGEGNWGTGQSFSHAEGTTAPTDPQDLTKILNIYPDSPYHAKAQVMPSFVLSNFGVAAFGIQTEDAELNSATGTIHLDYRRDVGAAIGYNLRLWDGRIKLGTTARIFDRVEINTDFDKSVTGLTYDTMVSEGGALAVDGGLILTAPIQWLPSISGVVRDIGGTEFSVGGEGGGLFYNTGTVPSSVRQAVDAGFSLSPILAKRARMVIGAEMRDITNADDRERDHPQRRLHYGAEFNFGDTLFLRGGVNQFYWTAGFEYATRFFHLQGATYGEDIGSPGSPRQDRRYVGKLTIQF